MKKMENHLYKLIKKQKKKVEKKLKKKNIKFHYL